MITIGRGQRELITGERQTGKVAVATYMIFQSTGAKFDMF